MAAIEVEGRSASNRQALIIVAIFVAAVVASLPLYSYEWHLMLHIFGAVIFLGNFIVSAMWMALAERTRESSVVHFASKSVGWADQVFTGPGVVLVLLNGMALAADRWGGWGSFHETGWITAGLLLFAASGLVWVGFLQRYQSTLGRLSKEAVDTGAGLSDEFFGALHMWYFWGIVAIILPLVSLALMVFKPDLW